MRRAALILTMACGFLASPLQSAEVEGFRIEDFATIAGYEKPLRLNGVATMQRNFLPYYAAALYLPLSTKSRAGLLDGLTAFRVTAVWLMPEQSKDRVQQYWRQAFKLAVGADDYKRVEDRIEKFVGIFDSIHRGDQTIIDYNPDAGLRVRHQGRPVVSVAGMEFNRALLRIWLGPASPPEFRDALLKSLSE